MMSDEARALKEIKDELRRIRLALERSNNITLMRFATAVTDEVNKDMSTEDDLK